MQTKIINSRQLTFISIKISYVQSQPQLLRCSNIAIADFEHNFSNRDVKL